MKAEKIIREHMRKLGAKGGSKSTKAKKLASEVSLAKARKARWSKKPRSKRKGAK